MLLILCFIALVPDNLPLFAQIQQSELQQGQPTFSSGQVDFGKACLFAQGPITYPITLPEKFERPWKDEKTLRESTKPDPSILSKTSPASLFFSPAKAHAMDLSLESAQIASMATGTTDILVQQNGPSASRIRLALENSRNAAVSKADADNDHLQITSLFNLEELQVLQQPIPFEFKLPIGAITLLSKLERSESFFRQYSSHWSSALDSQLDALQAANAAYNGELDDIYGAVSELSFMGASSPCYFGKAKEQYVASSNLLAGASGRQQNDFYKITAALQNKNEGLRLHLQNQYNVIDFGDFDVAGNFNLLLLGQTATGQGSGAVSGQPLLEQLHLTSRATRKAVELMAQEAEVSRQTALSASKKAQEAANYFDGNGVAEVLVYAGLEDNRQLSLARSKIALADSYFMSGQQITGQSPNWAISKIHYFNESVHLYSNSEAYYVTSARIAEDYLWQRRESLALRLVRLKSALSEKHQGFALDKIRSQNIEDLFVQARDGLADAKKPGAPLSWQLEKLNSAQSDIEEAESILLSWSLAGPNASTNLEARLAYFSLLVKGAQADGIDATAYSNALSEYETTYQNSRIQPLAIRHLQNQLELSIESLSDQLNLEYAPLSEKFLVLENQAAFFPNLNQEFDSVSNWFASGKPNLALVAGKRKSVEANLLELSAKIEAQKPQVLSSFMQKTVSVQDFEPKTYSNEPALFKTQVSVSNPTSLVFYGGQPQQNQQVLTTDGIQKRKVEVLFTSQTPYQSSDLRFKSDGIVGIERLQPAKSGGVVSAGRQPQFAIYLDKIGAHENNRLELAGNFTPLLAYVSSKTSQIRKEQAQVSQVVELRPDFPLARPHLRLQVPNSTTAVSATLDNRELGTIIESSSQAGLPSTFAIVTLPQLEQQSYKARFSYQIDNPFSVQITNTTVSALQNGLQLSTTATIFGIKEDFENIEVSIPAFVSTSSNVKISPLGQDTEVSGVKVSNPGGLGTVSFLLLNPKKGRTYSLKITGASTDAANFTSDYLAAARLSLSSKNTTSKYMRGIEAAQALYDSGDVLQAARLAYETISKAQAESEKLGGFKESFDTGYNKTRGRLDSANQAYLVLAKASNSDSKQIPSQVSKALLLLDTAAEKYSEGDFEGAEESRRLAQGVISKIDVSEFEHQALIQADGQNERELASEEKLFGPGSAQFKIISNLRAGLKSQIRHGLQLVQYGQPSDTTGIYLQLENISAISKDAQNQMQAQAYLLAANASSSIARANGALSKLAKEKTVLSRSRTVRLSLDIEKAQSSLSRASKALEKIPDKQSGRQISLESAQQAAFANQEASSTLSSVLGQLSRLEKAADEKSLDAQALTILAMNMSYGKGPEFEAKAKQANDLAAQARSRLEEGNFAESIIASESSIKSSNELILAAGSKKQDSLAVPIAAVVALIVVLCAAYYLKTRGRQSKAIAKNQHTLQSSQQHSQSRVFSFGLGGRPPSENEAAKKTLRKLEDD
ncbi:hypothetical protein FJZ26_01025 [Candidatus Parvarchaeota archaeon]|nr:hypothetical protein [Candidatus Parvarchaeota archaeon]